MWPANEFQESRPVALFLGEEKTKIEGLETSFLATISPVFRAMFYDGYAEAQKDSIEFPECDKVATEKILNAMKDAMRDNMSVEDKIEEIISPKLYSTLRFFQIGSNLERCALSRMRFDELEEYKTLANQDAEGNKWLLKAIEWKTLTFFLKYRRTESFKKMSIEELVAYLSHPYLEYRVEKEVLEAALFWLNYDFKHRKVYMKKVLSCVNWNRITKSQSKAACSLKFLRRSATLRDFFDGIYEKKSLKLNKEEETKPSDLKGYKWAAELLNDKTRKKRRYLLSVPFAFRETPEDIWTYGVCIYNSKTEKFKEHVFLLPRNHPTDALGFVDVKFFDFHVYSFMRAASDIRPRTGPLSFKIEKHSTLKDGPQKWKYLGKYGQVGGEKSYRIYDEDEEQEAPPIPRPAPEDPFKMKKISVVSRGTKMIISNNFKSNTFDTYKETVTPNYVFDDGNHGHTIKSVAKEHKRLISRRPPPPPPAPNPEGQGPSRYDLMELAHLRATVRGPLCAAFAKTVETPASLAVFEDQLKFHVESKINKDLMIFVTAPHLVQRVNPLWFKNFP